MRIRAIEYRKIAVIEVFSGSLEFDPFDDELRLVFGRFARRRANLVALFLATPKPLFMARGVSSDDVVGCIEDDLRLPIILFERHSLHPFE